MCSCVLTTKRPAAAWHEAFTVSPINRRPVRPSFSSWLILHRFICLNDAPSALCKKQEMHHVRRGLKNCFMVTVKAKNQSLRLKPGYKWADSFPKKMPHAKKYIPSSHRIYFLYSLLPSLSRESLSHIKSPILLHLLCQVSPFLLLYRLGQIPPLSFPFLYLLCLCLFHTFSPLRVQSIFIHASCSYITRLRAQFQSHN